MIDETLQEQAALHALGMLSGEEATAFRAALARQPELQTLVDDLAEAAAALTHAVPSAKAPTEVLPRLLTQIRAERMRTNTTPGRGSAVSWMPWALAAGIALAASVGFIAGARVESVNTQVQVAKMSAQIEQADVERQRLATLLSSLKEERGSLEKRIADLRQRELLSQIKIATLRVQLKAYAKVAAVAVWDATSQQGVIRFDNLPPAGAGKDYQMWIIEDQNPVPVSAGIFTAESGTEFDARLRPSRPIAVAGKFAVSLEPKNGSAEPAGPILLMSN